MRHLFFYIQYAARNLWRNRRWSAFAMLSIAAGVAAMVALRSLGLAMDDALTSNIRASLHGDIVLERGFNAFLPIGLADDEMPSFTDQQVEKVRAWVEERGGQVATYNRVSLQIAGADGAGTVGLLNFVTAFFIDPDVYPLTQDIRALEPERVPLSDLFQGGPEAVISSNLAEAQNISVGDALFVSGTDTPFVVRGIVPLEIEADLRDPFTSFFGFVYFPVDLAETLAAEAQPNVITVLLPDSYSHADIEREANQLYNLVARGGSYRIRSVPSVLEQNEVIADVTGRFIVVMGLGAMLIGGVGIINTMLVLVRRRTEEIAVLKTFGLKGRQVAAMFMTEGLMLGAFGSLFGCVAGIALSGLANQYGETFIQQPLRWRVYPEALWFGLILGMVVTAVFGVMPVLTAVRVRPGIILRPNETYVPALGLLQSVGVTLFVVVALGLIAGHIIGPLPEGGPSLLTRWPLATHYVLGLIGVGVTLLILTLLVGVMWLLVWLVGKLPSFGSVDLRLALTNLSTRRLRTATTLLAISTGMFALSSISFYGAGAREILQFTLTETFGGNVMILSPASLPVSPLIANASQRQLDNRLDELEGVISRTQLINDNARIVAINGQRVGRESEHFEALAREQREAIEAGDFERSQELTEQLSAYFGNWVDVLIRDTTDPEFASSEVERGRRLTTEDRGRPVAVVSRTPFMVSHDVTLGSTITLSREGLEQTVEVVGLTADEGNNIQGVFNGDVQLPPDVLARSDSGFRLNTAYVEPERLNEVLVSLSSIPAVYPIDISFIDGVIGRFIDQFSALPALVGLLSLMAAAVIMANTVALATLERRRQIGILKALGLKGRRVLSIMLLENTMVSLLGGVLGIGLSALGIVVMSWFGLEDLVLIPTNARPAAVALVLAAVLIGATATLLSANVAVRERVLHVLRYD